jgi:antitoxin CptB
MTETPEHRIKRLKMRSMRRGIKEMDIILSAYADQTLHHKADADLLLYDSLLNENDQDLYQWVTGQVETPEKYSKLMSEISQTLQK